MMETISKIGLDVHTHTVASGHAYNTIQEMAAAASRKGLKLLGITEHGPVVNGACQPIYFQNLRVVPRRMYGVEMMLGAELNILDSSGKLDLDNRIINSLDIRIAGIHSGIYRQDTTDNNTTGMLAVINKPLVDIISHPGDGTAALDFEPIVIAAKRYHVLLEINNSSMVPRRDKTLARENNLQILSLCKRYNVLVILGSDAHISFDIANNDNLHLLLLENDFLRS